MICDQCKTAGESLRDPAYGSLEQRQALAARIHARCINPETCACQHRTDPNTLNPERIQRDKTVST